MRTSSVLADYRKLVLICSDMKITQVEDLFLFSFFECRNIYLRSLLIWAKRRGEKTFVTEKFGILWKLISVFVDRNFGKKICMFCLICFMQYWWYRFKLLPYKSSESYSLIFIHTSPRHSHSLLLWHDSYYRKLCLSLVADWLFINAFLFTCVGDNVSMCMLTNIITPQWQID